MSVHEEARTALAEALAVSDNFGTPRTMVRTEDLRALIAEHERLIALRERWQEIVETPSFREAVESEARAYHESACSYRREVESLTAPPTDDEREALARVIVEHRCLARGIPLDRITTFDIDVVGRPLSDAILASDVWRNRRQGPITDAAVNAAALMYFGPSVVYDRELMRAALEAARAAS